MEVQILSRKLVTPSSSTPNHLRNFKISAMDQFQNPVYVASIFYYSTNGNDHRAKNAERIKQLEKSLSQTLTVFYPLAGRYINENLLIDCNDHGVEFLEARVSGQLAQLLDGEPEAKILNRFIPLIFTESATNPLVAVQINIFECGGVAIGVRMSHRIADGSSMLAFINAWATACREGSDKVHCPSFHLASLFPTREMCKFKPVPRSKGANVVTKIFVFNKVAISNLKAIVNAGASDLGVLEYHPSRVEVVTALIWRTLIKVSQAKHGYSRPFLVTHSLNIRGKTTLPISENSFGNLYMLSMVRFAPDGSKIGLYDLVGLTRDSIRKAIMDCKKAPNGDDLFLTVFNSFKAVSEEFDNGDADLYMFASWCKFPVYEVDFGWGKPSWVSRVHKPVELMQMMDTRDGDGIEVWVSLPEKDMLPFEQDPDIISFTSPSRAASLDKIITPLRMDSSINLISEHQPYSGEERLPLTNSTLGGALQGL